MDKSEAVQQMLSQWGNQVSRWAQIVFWTAEDLAELHRRETWLTKRSGKSAVSYDLSMMEQMNLKNQILPFWDRKIEDYERNERMKMFRAKVFPVWAPIVTRAIETEINDKQDRRECDFVEIKVLHECDKAVMLSGHRVDRYAPQNERKAKSVEQAREVYGV